MLAQTKVDTNKYQRECEPSSSNSAYCSNFHACDSTCTFLHVFGYILFCASHCFVNSKLNYVQRQTITTHQQWLTLSIRMSKVYTNSIQWACRFRCFLIHRVIKVHWSTIAAKWRKNSYLCEVNKEIGSFLKPRLRANL